MKYTGGSLDLPKTQEQKRQKEAKKQAQEEERAKQVDELNNELGKKIDGLIYHVTDSLKVKHTDIPAEELATASLGRKLANRIHRAWAAFANVCIRKLVKLSFFLLKVKPKVQTVARSFHKDIKKIQQDAFIVTIGRFSYKELRDIKDST